MALPALELLRAQGFQVQLVGKHWLNELFAATDMPCWVLQGRLLKDARQLRLARRNQVVASKQRLGLILPNSLSSAALFRLAGLRSVGYARDGRSLLLRWPIQPPKIHSARHEVERFYDLTRRALIGWGENPLALPDAPPAQLRLPVTITQQARVEALLQSHGLQNFVLLAPTAVGRHAGKSKVWPHFPALGQQLQRLGFSVVTCPPAAERAAVAAAFPEWHCLEPLPLDAYIALCARADWVICNDSGVSHLASVSGARQITLFGTTDAGRTRPWSSRAVCLGGQGIWPSVDQVVDALGLPEPDRSAKEVAK